jgi:hypothetical protein
MHRGTAGSKHGVHHDHEGLGKVGRELHEVLYGFQRGWIAVKADVTNPGAGDKGEDPVEHDDSRAEDRDKDHRTGQFHPLGPLKRGLHLHRPHRKIPGYLVDHEGGELLRISRNCRRSVRLSRSFVSLAWIRGWFTKTKFSMISKIIQGKGLCQAK